MNIFLLLNDQLYKIREMFAGALFNRDSAAEQELKELLEGDIPGFREDRRNLMNDRNAVMKDYSKAFNEKRAEYL